MSAQPCGMISFDGGTTEGWNLLPTGSPFQCMMLQMAVCLDLWHKPLKGCQEGYVLALLPTRHCTKHPLDLT
jgi:hypothetical protein